MHFKHECADGICLSLSLFALIPKFLDLVADGDVALFVAFVLPTELCLIHCICCVLLDKLSCKTRNYFSLLEQVGNLAVNLRGVGQHVHHPSAVIQNVLSVRDEAVIGCDKPCLDIILIQMRCGAAVSLVLELIVALPYRPFVLARGVPGLGSEETAAVFADKPCAEYAVSTVASAETLSPCNLELHQFPILRRDDGIVGMLDVVLRNFSVVLFHLVLQEVYREFFLLYYSQKVSGSR